MKGEKMSAATMSKPSHASGGKATVGRLFFLK
jgi:hypothetical protein